MGECIDNIGFIFSKITNTIKCNKKYNNCKVTCMKLEKKYFVSSTLTISTTIEEAWEGFKNNIINLVNANFVISATKCSKLHSFGAKLIKIKVCKCCDIIHLYFNYNIIPNSINNATCNNICIPVELTSNVPTTSCIPSNYWPNTPDEVYDSNKSPCANIVGNIFYDLESTIYTDVKFYYNTLYCNDVNFYKSKC